MLTENDRMMEIACAYRSNIAAYPRAEQYHATIFITEFDVIEPEIISARDYFDYFADICFCTYRASAALCIDAPSLMPSRIEDDAGIESRRADMAR